MEIHIKGNGKMILSMDMGKVWIQMEILMREIGKIIKEKEKENFNGMMEINMMANGKME